MGQGLPTWPATYQRFFLGVSNLSLRKIYFVAHVNVIQPDEPHLENRFLTKKKKVCLNATNTEQNSRVVLVDRSPHVSLAVSKTDEAKLIMYRIYENKHVPNCVIVS